MELLLLLEIGRLHRIDINRKGMFQTKAGKMIQLARGLNGVAGFAKQCACFDRPLAGPADLVRSLFGIAHAMHFRGLKDKNKSVQKGDRYSVKSPFFRRWPRRCRQGHNHSESRESPA
jgi:hypothetical protein